MNLAGQGPVVFALAFWVVHEVPDQRRFFEEVADILTPGGRLLFAEPKMHVSASEFQASCDLEKSHFFMGVGRPWILFSRAAVLQKESAI